MSRQSRRIRLRKQARQEQEDDSHHAGMNEGVDVCDSEDRTPYTRRSERIRSRRITLQGEHSEKDDLHPSDHTVMNVEDDARASEGASASEADVVEDIALSQAAASAVGHIPDVPAIGTDNDADVTGIDDILRGESQCPTRHHPSSP